MVTMEQTIQTHSSATDHLTTLNLNNFKMIEAMGLKINVESHGDDDDDDASLG
jgi:hypothetical protein